MEPPHPTLEHLQGIPAVEGKLGHQWPAEGRSAWEAGSRFLDRAANLELCKIPRKDGRLRGAGRGGPRASPERRVGGVSRGGGLNFLSPSGNGGVARTRGSAIEPGAGRRGGTKETKGAGRTPRLPDRGQRGWHPRPGAGRGKKVGRPKPTGLGASIPRAFLLHLFGGVRTHPPRFGSSTPKPRSLATECPTPSRESSGGSSFLLSDQTLTRRLQLAPHPARVAKHVLLSCHPCPLPPTPCQPGMVTRTPAPPTPGLPFVRPPWAQPGPHPLPGDVEGVARAQGGPWGSVPGSHLRRLDGGASGAVHLLTAALRPRGWSS